MGSWRFRRSVKIAPGVRLNFNKRSVGISAGVRGARYSVNSDGRRNRSLGIPGSGLYYRSQGGGRPRFTDSSEFGELESSPTRVIASLVGWLTVLVFGIGLFAGSPGFAGTVAGVLIIIYIALRVMRGFLDPLLFSLLARTPSTDDRSTNSTDANAFTPSEQALREAIRGEDWSLVGDFGDADDDLRVPAYAVAGVMMMKEDEQRDRAKQMLDSVFDSGQEPRDYPVMRDVETAVSINVADGVTTPELPIGRMAVGLLLATAHEKDGELTRAREILDGLPSSRWKTTLLEGLNA
jgi:Protein of unknown function (DUF4236)